MAKTPATVTDVVPADFAAAWAGAMATVAAATVKPPTARDIARKVDLAIIAAASKLVDELAPAPLRDEVARLIANQLHHLSTPALGWPAANLPRPDRSDWR